ncbi:MAG: hypothetical protein ACYS9X_17230 [Planctomycetota bacterium]|jgi:hypothetical protein
MSLDLSSLADEMKAAAANALKTKWSEVKEYAATEFRKLGESFLMLERMKLAGELDEEEARLYLDIQKNALRAVILAVEGIGLVAAERAINSALGAVSNAVNKALGFPLL